MGLEQPETYRRNYGLTLWKAGYDGAMDFAYAYPFDFVWDDFDNPIFKDHVSAYPSMNGVIDTIQWEGFREGVDDVRYLSTLLKYINLAKAQTVNVHDLGVQAQNWVDSADFSNGDLDQIRTDMITQTKNIYTALPTPFTLSSPADNSSTSRAQPTFSWNASSDSESGLAKYQLYIDSSLNRDNISSSSVSTTPVSALSEGDHTWYIVAVNAAGNTTQSTSTWTIKIDTAAPTGGSISYTDGYY